MSYERSFHYMDLDELVLKKRFDEYRLETLNAGVVAPLRKWGFGGLDEAWYALTRKVVSSKTRSYLEEQIALAEAELEHREKSGLSTKVEHLIEIEPNPATFFTFRDEREVLRKQRLKKMEAAGEQLYPREYFALVAQLTAETAESVANSFGAFGTWTSRNFLTLSCVGAFSCSGFTGYKYLCYAEVYKGVAEEYRESHQVGPYALPLKRDIPDEVILVGVNLTYTPPVTITTKNSTIHVPEKRSSPSLAMIEINRIDDTLKENLSDAEIGSFEGFTDQEKHRLAAYRDDAHDNFVMAYASLVGEWNTGISYPHEIALVVSGNDYVQNAVGVLESHMDKKIVTKENNAYDQMSLWKWLTIGLGLVGGVLGYSAFKNAEHRSRYDRYYGSY